VSDARYGLRAERISRAALSAMLLMY